MTLIGLSSCYLPHKPPLPAKLLALEANLALTVEQMLLELTQLLDPNRPVDRVNLLQATKVPPAHPAQYLPMLCCYVFVLCYLLCNAQGVPV